MIIKDLPDLSALDKTVLYGASRAHYKTYTDFHKDKATSPDRYGIPIGYYQLYFDKTLFYPEHSRTCAQCDLTFCRRFPRNEVLKTIVYHLGEPTVNWSGRKTKKWL